MEIPQEIKTEISRSWLSKFLSHWVSRVVIGGLITTMIGFGSKIAIAYEVEQNKKIDSTKIELKKEIDDLKNKKVDKELHDEQIKMIREILLDMKEIQKEIKEDLKTVKKNTKK